VKLHYPFGKPPEGLDVLWRCEAKRYSYVIDPDADRYGVTDPQLELCWYAVARRTARGAWLVGGEFQRLTAFKKRYSETEEDAVNDFKARKRKQIDIVTRQLQRAQEELALTEPHPLDRLALRVA